MPTVDQLDIELAASSQKASAAIDTLISKLGVLSKALNVNINTSGIDKLSTSLQNLSGTNIDRSITNMTSAMARLAKSSQGLGTAASGLPTFTNALNKTFSVMARTSEISQGTTQFTSALARLANAGGKATQAASGINALTKSVQSFFVAMQNAPEISQNTLRLVEALAKLSGVSTRNWSGASKGIQTLASATSSAAGRIKSSCNGISSAYKSVGKGSSALTLATTRVSSMVKAFIGLRAVQALYSWSKEAVSLGSSITEVENVVDTAFGNMSQKAYDFASTASSQFGLSELAAKQYSGTMMAILKSSGVAQSAASDMSLTLAGLAGDIASFYNIDTDLAFEKIRSGITGEVEPLRQLGINMSVANIEAYALSQGITASYDSMNSAEKTLLRYNYLLSVTGDQQGDFSKTSGTWANQVRLLQLQWQMLSATIGQAFIAVLTPVVTALNKLIAKLQVAATAFRNFVLAVTGANLGGASGAVQNAVSGLSDSSDTLSNLGSASDSAASGLSDASDSAATLKKTLSVLPFDELNQLGTQNSSSGSSGGGTGSDLGSVGSFDIGDSTPIDQASGKLDGMLSKLRAIADIFKAGFFNGLGDYIPQLEDINQKIQMLKKNLQEIFTDSDVVSAAQSFGTKVVYALGQITGAVASIGLTIGQNLIGGASLYVEQNKDKIKTFFVNAFDVSGAIAEQAGKIAAAIADIFSVFGSEKAQQVTADIIGIFSGAFASAFNLASGLVKNGLTNIATAIETNKSRIKSAFEGTFDGLHSVFGTLSDAMSTFASKVVPQIVDGVQKMHDVFQPFNDFLADTFFSVWTDMLNPALTYLGETVLPVVLGTLNNLWNGVLVPLGNLLASVLAPIVSTLSSVLGTLYETVIKPLAQFLGSVFNVAFQTLAIILNGVIIPAVSALLTVLQGLWDNVFVPLGSFLVDTFGPAFEYVADTVKIVLETVTGAVDWIGDKLGALSDWLTDIDWDSASKGASDAWSSVKKHTKAAWDTVTETVGGAVSSVASGVKDKFGNAVSTAKDKWSAIKTSTSDTWGNIKSTVGNKLSNAKDNVVKNATAIKSSMQSKFTSALTVAKEKFNSIKEKITSPMRKAKEFVTNAIQTIKKAFNFTAQFKLKLPHISVDGGEAPWGIGGAGRLPSFSVRWYRNGGFIGGELWGMNETGNPEMVGRMGNGKTAVANNAIIEKAISSAVEQAMTNVMMRYASSTNNRSDDYVTVNVDLDGDTIARVLTKAQKRRNGRLSPSY